MLPSVWRVLSPHREVLSAVQHMPAQPQVVNDHLGHGVAVGSDGGRYITASRDGCVCVWKSNLALTRTIQVRGWVRLRSGRGPGGYWGCDTSSFLGFKLLVRWCTDCYACQSPLRWRPRAYHCSHCAVLMPQQTPSVTTDNLILLYCCLPVCCPTPPLLAHQLEPVRQKTIWVTDLVALPNVNKFVAASTENALSQCMHTHTHARVCTCVPGLSLTQFAMTCQLQVTLSK